MTEREPTTRLTLYTGDRLNRFTIPDFVLSVMNPKIVPYEMNFKDISTWIVKCSYTKDDKSSY